MWLSVCVCVWSDFGVDHLVEIAGETEFPWLMSNVRDKRTGRLLAEGHETLVLDWEGRKVCGCLSVCLS